MTENAVISREIKANSKNKTNHMIGIKFALYNYSISEKAQSRLIFYMLLYIPVNDLDIKRCTFAFDYKGKEIKNVNISRKKGSNNRRQRRNTGTGNRRMC